MLNAKTEVNPDVLAGFTHGPGRIYKPDERDKPFRMAAIAKTAIEILPSIPLQRYWSSQWFGFQGDTGRCTAYAAINMWEDGPVTHRGPKPFMDPTELYQRIREADGFSADPSLQDGATVRGIGEALRAMGMVDSYHWANPDPEKAVDEIATTILVKGPVIMGTDWTADMFSPQRIGPTVVRGYVEPTGFVAGGHSYVLNGYSRKNDTFRGECAWSEESAWWFRIKRAGLVKLMRGIESPGEAMVCVENPTPKK